MRRVEKREAGRAGLRPVDDDDDYNNRAFRGFEITVHAAPVQIIYWSAFSTTYKANYRWQ